MRNFNYHTIYFLGIGGIGMSALARYFNYHNYRVLGYDKTETELTKSLVTEGIEVHYEDWGKQVVNKIGAPKDTLVVYTPAIPNDMEEMVFLRENAYRLEKRAAILEGITENYKTLAVAGVHGKTTTSSLLAHVLSQTNYKCNAFLGGIAANFDSNLIIEPNSEWMVVEADEYDRSFHQLKPFSSIITSIDPDHLDIYENRENMVKAFSLFAKLIAPAGKLILHHSVEVGHDLPHITYGLGDDIQADYHGYNLRVDGQELAFELKTPSAIFENVKLGVLGNHNIENALAVIAMCESLGLKFEDVSPFFPSFKGVKRRFEIIIKNEKIIYIDDYAHHPTAIEKLLDSIRLIYKDTPIYLIFQPHLYSRTKDFMREFAEVLGKADEVILMPIFPAREKPIEGITSENLAKLINGNVSVFNKEEILNYIPPLKSGVILTVGAGNIDQLVAPIKQILE